VTQAQLFAALRTLGMNVAYGSFDEPTKPPFLTYHFTVGADVMADNRNYAEVAGFSIELYTVKKDLPREKLVEDLLKANRLPYSKTGTWIESEKMWQTAYTVQLL